MAVDLTKAFNNVDHNKVINRLAKLAVPGWLIKLVVAFLSNRSLQCKWKDELSDKLSMPAGGPQGTILGQFVFVLLWVGAGPQDQEYSWGQVLALPPELRDPPSMLRAVFIDDLTILRAVDLKKTKMENIEEQNLVRPVPKHQRFELQPTNPPIQHDLDQLVQFTDNIDFQINSKKTKTILWNNRLVHDWLPE